MQSYIPGQAADLYAQLASHVRERAKGYLTVYITRSVPTVAIWRAMVNTVE